MKEFFQITVESDDIELAYLATAESFDLAKAIVEELQIVFPEFKNSLNIVELKVVDHFDDINEIIGDIMEAPPYEVDDEECEIPFKVDRSTGEIKGLQSREEKFNDALSIFQKAANA